MSHLDRILEIYYRVSKKTIDSNDLICVLPKVQLALNRIRLDNIEIVNLIDVLVDFKKVDMLDKITSESMNMIIDSICSDNNIDLSAYLPLMIKNSLLPFDVNRSDNENEILLFLSQYEITVEMIIKYFKKEDYITLKKYNEELANIIEAYRNSMKIYKRTIGKEYVLCNIIAHIATMLYFKLDEYNYNYELLERITCNLIKNYSDFIDYCQKEDIVDNFIHYYVGMDKIQKEYVISENILKYSYENEKGKGKSK